MLGTLICKGRKVVFIIQQFHELSFCTSGHIPSITAHPSWVKGTETLHSGSLFPNKRHSIEQLVIVHPYGLSSVIFKIYILWGSSSTCTKGPPPRYFLAPCTKGPLLPPISHLNMKINNMRSMQKVATLSMVFISTTSWRRKAGMNLTSFSTLSSRNVLSTDRPPSAWPIISQILQTRNKQNRRESAQGLKWNAEKDDRKGSKEKMKDKCAHWINSVFERTVN